MERFSRILIIMFFLLVVNMGLNIYLLRKVSKININYEPAQIINRVETTPLPSTKTLEASVSADIKSELNTIKVELRSIREALTVSKLITPE